ncbi:MAG: hypothetical protein Q9208_008761 [Pyrenodesmia sp. 3 TL-2023]
MTSPPGRRSSARIPNRQTTKPYWIVDHQALSRRPPPRKHPRVEQPLKLLEQPQFPSFTTEGIHKEDSFNPSSSTPTPHSLEGLRSTEPHLEQRYLNLAQPQSTSDYLDEQDPSNRTAPAHPRGRKRKESGPLEQDTHIELTAAERSQCQPRWRSSGQIDNQVDSAMLQKPHFHSLIACEAVVQDLNLCPPSKPNAKARRTGPTRHPH